jgi:hypothetical protein
MTPRARPSREDFARGRAYGCTSNAPTSHIAPPGSAAPGVTAYPGPPGPEAQQINSAARMHSSVLIGFSAMHAATAIVHCPASSSSSAQSPSLQRVPLLPPAP